MSTTTKAVPVGNAKIKLNRCFPLEGESKIKAFIDISVDDTFIIKGLRVVEGKNGLFVSMPQTQGKDKKWYPDVRCESMQISNDLQNTVLKMYQDEVAS